MTVIPGGPLDPADYASSPDMGADERCPSRADGVELIGEMEGSGYREPPSLVRRADGQTLQLTRLLYMVLSAVDGRTSPAQLAESVSEKSGRRVSEENVRTLIDSQLRPLGLLVRPDGSQPEVKKSNPLLGLRFRYAVTDAEKTRRLTAPFAHLFHPLIAVPVLGAFLFVCWWVLALKGLGSATHDAFENPALLLLVVAVTIFSSGFHEFGHAAAARYGGATPGAMGAGLYLFWPAFYTDVTDSYRLGRAGRVRTDLGGLYFNAIVTVLIAGIWWATGYDALLLVVLTQILQMLRQLTPLVRFDGYHVLADLTGVPDLFQRIKPTLLGLLPWRWGRPESKALKPWARAVVSIWVLIVVPLLLFSIVMMVLTLPRVLATAVVSIARQQSLLGDAWGHGDLPGGAAHILMILAAALPILGTGIVLVRMIRQGARAVWRKTRGRPGRRAGAAVAGALVCALLITAWWPNASTYRPIQRYDRGTITDAVSLVMPKPNRLVDGAQGRVAAIWPSGSVRPTADKPQLAMILIPRAPQTTAADTGAPAAEPAWVFPFDKPLPPGDGGNQALAVNTKDGSVTYDVAFALVWVDDGQALNKNEAYAFASCRDCGAVAIGFQVVLVVGHANVIVPQNLAAAANYNCVQCLTYALANQLVLTLDRPLSPAGTEQLAKIWDEVRNFEANIENIPLSELQSRLADYKTRIEQIITHDPSATQSESGTTAPAPSTTTSNTAPAPPDGGTSPIPGSAPTQAPVPQQPTPAASPPGTAQPVQTAVPAPATAQPAQTAPAPTQAPATPPATAVPGS
ncbi:hypothetical protein KNN17_21970 [Arthrobacter bambusae]|uniref:hypothetical protein n=1 Tax=Arthrobacter bambusae TaxID=1338426 RepID=UPI0027E1A80C|nr:hypothetical protein [Arthrobacter bambusae]MCI0144217.1 hypothetical protein [Arthrobacter bambusae]